MKNKCKKISVLLIIVIVAVFFEACKNVSSFGKTNSVEKTDTALGTIITVKVYGENADEATKKSFERVREIENKMSAKKEDSELSYVNNNAYNEDVKISEDLYYVIEKALYYSKLSDGAFDFTIGNLIDAWGIGTEKEHVLNNEEKKKYMGLKNYENVVLNKEKRTIRFENDKIKLDLGAIVKGYVADEMKRILVEDYNIKTAMLNLGGNVVTIGKKSDNSKWSVGIQNPKDKESISVILKLSDKMIVTSGNYERYFEKDGIRYHHIIDPATAMPAYNGIQSATIITDKSIDADALSTATYILGKEKVVNFIENIVGVDGIFILDDMTILKTKGIDNYNFTEVK